MFPAQDATLGNWRDSGTLPVAAQRYLGTSGGVPGGRAPSVVLLGTLGEKTARIGCPTEKQRGPHPPGCP